MNKKRKIENIETISKSISEGISNLKEELIEIPEKIFDLEEYLKCPITQEIYIQPYTLPCGHTIEKTALFEHLKRSETCPVCRRAFFLFDFCNLEINIVISNIIEKLYLNYKNEKLEEIKKKGLLILDAEEYIFYEYQKENIEKIDDFTQKAIRSIIKSGKTGTVPDGDSWVYILDLLIENKLLHEYYRKKWFKMGYELRFCFEKEYIEENGFPNVKNVYSKVVFKKINMIF